MRNPRMLAGGPPAPLRGQAPKGIRLIEPGADETAELLAFDPIHLDDGIPVALDEDTVFEVLEVDE